jgi:hypothetical protein
MGGGKVRHVMALMVSYLQAEAQHAASRRRPRAFSLRWPGNSLLTTGIEAGASVRVLRACKPVVAIQKSLARRGTALWP